jgi:hypothetical protein
MTRADDRYRGPREKAAAQAAEKNAGRGGLSG